MQELTEQKEFGKKVNQELETKYDNTPEAEKQNAKSEFYKPKKYSGTGLGVQIACEDPPTFIITNVPPGSLGHRLGFMVGDILRNPISYLSQAITEARNLDFHKFSIYRPTDETQTKSVIENIIDHLKTDSTDYECEKLTNKKFKSITQEIKGVIEKYPPDFIENGQKVSYQNFRTKYEAQAQAQPRI